jgi:hypothetical protein
MFIEKEAFEIFIKLIFFSQFQLIVDHGLHEALVVVLEEED